MLVSGNYSDADSKTHNIPRLQTPKAFFSHHRCLLDLNDRFESLGTSWGSTTVIFLIGVPKSHVSSASGKDEPHQVKLGGS